MWRGPAPARGLRAPAEAQAPGRRGSLVAGRAAPAARHPGARYGGPMAVPNPGRVRGDRGRRRARAGRRYRLAVRLSPPALAFGPGHRDVPDPRPAPRAGPARVCEGRRRARVEGPAEPALDGRAEWAWAAVEAPPSRPRAAVAERRVRATGRGTATRPGPARRRHVARLLGPHVPRQQRYVRADELPADAGPLPDRCGHAGRRCGGPRARPLRGDRDTLCGGGSPSRRCNGDRGEPPPGPAGPPERSDQLRSSRLPTGQGRNRDEKAAALAVPSGDT